MLNELENTAASIILENLLIAYPELEDYGLIDDELDHVRESDDDFEDFNEDDWDLVKKMVVWVLNTHGSQLLYLSIVDDYNTDFTESWNLELDGYGNPPTISFDDIWYGFNPFLNN